MIHQRKRFNYLGVHQRTLNTSNVIQNERPTKHGSIVSQNKNLLSNIQSMSNSQYQPRSFSRNSSAQKQQQPLNQIQNNLPQLNQRNSTIKIHVASNKENLYQSFSNSSYKKQNLSFSTKKQTNQELLQKIRQLQQQNNQLLKETEAKFLLMQTNLQKVQLILKEKQSLISALTQENRRLTQENRRLKQENTSQEQFRVNLEDEKQELLKMIGDKNKEISKFKSQIEKFSSIQSDLMNRINCLSQENQVLHEEILTQTKKPLLELVETQIQTQTQKQQPTQTILLLKQTVEFIQQTDLLSHQIEQLLQRSQQESSLTNFKQKYDSLFKKALQMEDQVYQLKGKVFDAETQKQIIQKEFNTYKLLYQVQQLNQKTRKIPTNL